MRMIRLSATLRTATRELVVFCIDSDCGLHVIIAIYSTELGQRSVGEEFHPRRVARKRRYLTEWCDPGIRALTRGVIRGAEALCDPGRCLIRGAG
jgi:hypothetical protein